MTCLTLGAKCSGETPEPIRAHNHKLDLIQVLAWNNLRSKTLKWRGELPGVEVGGVGGAFSHQGEAQVIPGGKGGTLGDTQP